MTLVDKVFSAQRNCVGRKVRVEYNGTCVVIVVLLLDNASIPHFNGS